MATDVQILDLIRRSLGYRLIDPRDKTKVDKALRREASVRPSSLVGQAAWELSKRIAGPPIPPPPPPPTFKKVAPRAAEAQDDSDARFCLVNPNGDLRPGVFRRADGKYSDDSGAVYTSLDGLDESGIRSPAPAVTKAKEIDGRDICSLPLFGDPTRNTGSWSV